MMNDPALYIVLISVHGLIRGHDLELGRDADTGGQTLYVVELARALARHPKVGRVDLLTRRIVDSRVAEDYGVAEEALPDAPGAFIIRLPAGSDEYLPKEALWPYLDQFSDHALAHIRQQGLPPALIHSHYADAGYVGMRLALQLGLPLVHTGHSLGRIKRQRLLAGGESARVLEQKYQLSQRIRVEEEVLATASLVIASTQDEIDTQYGQYDWADARRMRVIAPGVDLARFDPAPRLHMPIEQELARFLRDPQVPPILALSRPDERKNIATLIHAYGQNAELRARANLVIVAGNRDDIRDLEAGSRQVLTEILLLIDRYDLYGQVAYPRHHTPEDVPDLYRWAAARRGVFINPALTEPFGLTLIEAAACGLPILATEDGGPRDIIAACQNGELINPLDADEIGTKLLALLDDSARWQRYAENGLSGVRRHYTWQTHVAQYLAAIADLAPAPQRREPMAEAHQRLTADRLLLLGARMLEQPFEASERDALLELLHRHRRQLAFGIVSSRPRHEVLALLKARGLSIPGVLITRAGTQIHYGARLSRDRGWSRHIGVDWQGERVYELLAETPGLGMGRRSAQGLYAVHAFIEDESQFFGLDTLEHRLHDLDIPARISALSATEFLVLPQRASLGFAIRYLANQHDIPLEHILVVGSDQADLDLLSGNVLAARLGEPSKEAAASGIYHPEATGLAGVLEAIAHYDLTGACRAPVLDAE